MGALLSGAPYVPTPLRAIKKIIKEANIQKGWTIYDIGCGDGRFLHYASQKKPITAIGFELSPVVYLLARLKKIQWKSKGKIIFGNFKKHDLSDANLVFCYMMPKTLRAFIPKFEHDLKKGTKIISYAFNIGDWVPVKKIPRDTQLRIAPILIYEIGKHRKKSKRSTIPKTTRKKA